MDTEPVERKSKPTLSPGDKFGDCEVLRLIGNGAMGSVYLVASPDGREYALKVMDPSLIRRNDGYRRRFVKEAAFAMSIHHRNLITVHDAGEDAEKGLCYILMDYMSGGSLKDMLAARGALPITEAVSIASHVAFALEAAHSRGGHTPRHQTGQHPLLGRRHAEACRPRGRQVRGRR